MTLPNRRPCVTETIPAPQFKTEFAVSVSFNDGHPCEVFVVQRGKSGTEIEALLHDLGVAASRIMQGKPVE